MSEVTLGIRSRQECQNHLVEVAAGRAKIDPEAPSIWFSSMASMCQLLSSNNIGLLKMIVAEEPASISELSRISGRTVGNLSRTLKSFMDVGLLSFQETGNPRAKKPVVTATDFKIEISLGRLDSRQ